MWCALVGIADEGLVAAAEAGINPRRLALVPHPGDQLVAVTAALLDGVDLIALADTERLRANDRQRLAARARQSGAVLLPTGPWPTADLELAVVSGHWHGLGHDGHGRLRSRQAQLRASGRGMAHRQHNLTVLLPDSSGKITTPSRPTLGGAQDKTVVAAG
jgi:hypothetical protein